MKTTLFTVTAILLATSLTSCSSSEQSAANVAASAEHAGAMADSAASNAMVDVKQAITPTPNGQGFADTAGKNDAYEIAAAKLALTNASSQAVKDFAQEMITAHTESSAKIKAAAAKASPPITPKPALTEDQNEDLADLGKKKGAEFDSSYIDDQVDAHQTALALMRDYAEKGDVPSLKAAAAEIAPVVQKHLDHAKMMDK